VYEMLFIQSDEGHALVILIPRASDIDAELLAMCAQYATPAGGVVMRRSTASPIGHLWVASSFPEMTNDFANR
jgi:hypothetical protein